MVLSPGWPHILFRYLANGNALRQQKVFSWRSHIVQENVYMLGHELMRSLFGYSWDVVHVLCFLCSGWSKACHGIRVWLAGRTECMSFILSLRPALLQTAALI